MSGCDPVFSEPPGEVMHAPVRNRRGCPYCSKPVVVDDPDTYHEVTSWVTGPKLQSPKLRTRSGRVAHKTCIDKLIAGQSPDQDELDGIEET